MRHRIYVVLAWSLLALAPTDAWALFAFGEIGALASNAATDDPEYDFEMGEDDVSIATDGSGNYVAVWVTRDPALSDGGGEIAFSRSTDAGRTWSNAALIYGAPAVSGGVATSLARASNGTWLAAWRGAPTVSRSTDAGQTWSAPTVLPPSGTGLSNISLAGDGTGTWVVVWKSHDDLLPEENLFVSRSSDDGVTWTAPAPLPDAMTAAAGGFGQFDLATDGDGTWVCVWGDGGEAQIKASRSTDGGATWSPVIVIDDSYAVGFAFPEVAADGNGNWVAAWEADTDQVLVSLSSDDGQTWGPYQIIGGSASVNDDADRFRPEIVYSDAAWNVSWHQGIGPASDGIGQEGDIVGARSLDGGGTWTDFAALNVNAAKDNGVEPFEVNYEKEHAIAAAPGGSAVTAYVSTNPLGGTVGADVDILFARSDDFCPAIPSATCTLAAEPESSRMIYRNPAGARDQLKWTWRRGGETSLMDFGSPTATTDYALCIYDKAGGTVRDVMEAHALAGGTCKDGPCWTATGDGWRYKDGDGRHGAIRSLRLESGEAGTASISLRARGPALAPAPTPLAVDPAVRVQLLNTENGECWEAVFSSSLDNTVESFRAVSD